SPLIMKSETVGKAEGKNSLSCWGKSQQRFCVRGPACYEWFLDKKMGQLDQGKRLARCLEIPFTVRRDKPA
ncbi:MAG: hypothetical protein WBW53_01265, partial [Terriglobales bacterium]